MEMEYIRQEVRPSLLVKDYEIAQSADINQTVFYDESILFYPETILVKQTQAVNITFFVLFLILVAVAVVANLFTIYVSYTRKNRLLYRVCLISLASSDLIVAVMSGINNIPKFLLPSHNFFILGEFMCSFMPLLQNTSLLANSMTLSCIAVDRYQMVVQAVRGRWDPGKYVCFGVVAGIWVISAGVASPMYGLYLWITAMIIQDDGVNITILEQYSVFHMCLLDDKTFKYTYFLIVFSFIFLPLLCTFLVLYILVVRYLLLWRRPGSCLSVQNTPDVGETDRKKTLFTFQRQGHKTVVPPTFIVKEVTKKDDGDPPQTFNVDLIDQRTKGNKYSVSRPDDGSTNRTRKFAAQVPVNQGRTTHAARKLRTFKIIMALMITFICLRMPSWIFTIYLLNPKSSTSGNFWWNVQNVFSLLVVLNCSINPFLYCFLNQVLSIYDVFRGALTRFLRRCRLRRGEKEAREVAVNSAEGEDEFAVEGSPQMLMVPRGPYSHQGQDQPQTGQDKSGSPQGTCSTGVNSNNTSPSLKNRGQHIDPDRCIVQKPFYVYS